MKNIYETIEDNPDLSLFLSFIKKTGTEKLFTVKGSKTVFVPTNLGCDCIKNEDNIHDKKRLEEIVKYHIIPEKIRAADLIPFKLRKTAHGQDVCLEANVVQVNGSVIIKSDIECKNGIMHIINSILIPRDMTCVPQKPKNAPKSNSQYR